MTFREHSAFPGWSDWRLAREAVWLRSRTCTSDDPQAEKNQRIRKAFTTDEVRRIDAYLAAAAPDTGRLAAIEARFDDATEDTKWLTQQLRRAWAQLDTLRDRLDDAGSLMDPDYVASAIGYVR